VLVGIAGPGLVDVEDILGYSLGQLQSRVCKAGRDGRLLLNLVSTEPSRYPQGDQSSLTRISASAKQLSIQVEGLKLAHKSRQNSDAEVGSRQLQWRRELAMAPLKTILPLAESDEESIVPASTESL